ncbi:MAG: N-6 DNA methylase, partial [Deltaproteobacteria bacterium]|nr:N-6 DNA methylase [Deltaproteobacteria bacterium]
MSKEHFKEKLISLITRFERDKHHYLSKDYLEAQVRQDFIDPFFEALGWDMGTKKGLSQFDREVNLEKGETTGRPDYNFRTGGRTKFFVEAKPPSVALDNTNHILQAKSYAWSTKEVWFVVLTDFEEFKLFDASLKPDPRHPREGLIFDLKHTAYLENIEKLWLLSREEVEAGSLERLLPRDVKSKRLRIPVDKSFLEDMTSWREALAKDIHKRNPLLDTRLLNESVQRLLDRLIFIRIAEDRKIRDPRELKEIAEIWRQEGMRKPLLAHLKDLFAEVNDDLNGDIFKPHVCETVDVDSTLLASIIEGLYFPESRYRFDVIGVELLGSIYERYLGSTIRITAKRAVVEEKPEVRKAGGVYYTPKYIVDYIVKNTVRRLIEGKTPKQIEKFKILDPACGSGSFLIGAYQELLNYHLEYYRSHPKETKTISFDFYQRFSPEDFALPLRLKAKILKNNIYGVDIDPQAVEITMMSLYLKLLEGERNLPTKQALLPGLSSNIKCGNSLIGYDFFESPMLPLLDNPPRNPLSPALRKGE